MNPEDPKDRVLDAVARAGNHLAHGINNLLTAVSGYLEIAGTRLEADHPAAMPLMESTRAVERLADALHRLMGFARRLRLDPRAIDLVAFLERRRRTLEGLAGPEASLRLELPAATLPVRADPVALEEALAVLLGNARDATEGRGRITLRAEAAEGATPGAGPGARIRVSDDGPGLPDEVRDRLFEPFVTTKSKTGALGLSLAWLRGFARQSGGDLRAVSAPGQGATFVLDLPAPGPKDPPLEDPDPPRGGGETVLLVEGDARPRRTAEAVLRSLGYRVAAAEDAAAALDAASVASPPVAAALVAILLPQGLDGITLAARLEGAHPGLPVVLVTSASPIGVPATTGRPLLRRPFGWADLALAVRTALDRR